MIDFKSLFQRKSKEERVKEILDNLVNELKKANVSNDIIVNRLKELNVPEKVINQYFELNAIKQEVTQMPKENKEKDYEEEIEELEETETEDEDAEEADEEEEPKKPVKKGKKEEEGPTLNQVLNQLNVRLSNVEAALFRLKSI